MRMVLGAVVTAVVAVGRVMSTPVSLTNEVVTRKKISRMNTMSMSGAIFSSRVCFWARLAAVILSIVVFLSRPAETGAVRVT
jgi:hypothetical protein